MILHIATALAVGIYVVLSKDVLHKGLDAAPRQSFQHSADHSIDGACASAPSARFMTISIRTESNKRSAFSRDLQTSRPIAAPATRAFIDNPVSPTSPHPSFAADKATAEAPSLSLPA
jgi:hypothetical protein